MKTKIIATIIMASMFIGIMSGCGSNVETEVSSQTQEETVVENDEEHVEEDVTEDVVEEEKEDVTDETTEEIVAENNVEEVVEEFTIDTAGVKVASIMDAYIEITNIENTDNYACIGRTENVSVYDDYTIETKTSDGFDLNAPENEEDYDIRNSLACINIYPTYLYDYVNKEIKNTNFNEYISSHTLDELFYGYKDKTSADEEANNPAIDLDSNLMLHAAKFLPLVVQITAGEGKSMEVKDLITEGFSVESVSGIPVAYEVSLYFDGAFSGINVGFDSDGNMLNFFYEEGGMVDSYGGYTYTFE